MIYWFVMDNNQQCFSEKKMLEKNLLELLCELNRGISLLFRARSVFYFSLMEMIIHQIAMLNEQKMDMHFHCQ